MWWVELLLVLVAQVGRWFSCGMMWMSMFGHV